MPEELNFRVKDSFVMEFEASRTPRAGGLLANVEIEFEVVKSSFSPANQTVNVECEYLVRVVEAEPDGDLDPLLATLRVRVVVIMAASRAISPEDAQEGRLDSAQTVAHAAAHPYMRAHLRYMATAMSIPPIPVPVGFEDVSEMMVDSDDSDPNPG